MRVERQFATAGSLRSGGGWKDAALLCGAAARLFVFGDGVASLRQGWEDAALWQAAAYL